MKKQEVSVIPRHLVTVRFIDVPSLDKAEIDNMVKLQAIKEIPYPKEEMVVSYRNLGSYKDGFSSIMLVIAKKEIVNKMLQERDPAGIKVETIRLNSELVYLFLLKKGMLDPNKVTLVIHIDKEHSEIMIVDKKRPVFSRGFKNSDRFLEEIDRSMFVYNRDRAYPEVEEVLVAYPPDVDIEDAGQHLKGHFNLQVNFYEYFDSLTDIDLSLEIGLLPEELTAKKSKARKRQEFLITYSLIGFVVVLCFALFTLKIYEKKRLLTILSSKIAKLQLETDQLDKFLKKIDVAKKHREEGKFIIDTLEYSYNLIPADIVLSRLSYDKVDGIFYRGTTENNSSIFTFVKRLEKSKYFDKVEIKQATKKKVKQKELTEFNIQCHLNTN